MKEFNKLIQVHIKETFGSTPCHLANELLEVVFFGYIVSTCFKTYHARKQSCNYFNCQIMALIVFGIIFEIV
jgi:hypothetical protein